MQRKVDENYCEVLQRYSVEKEGDFYSVLHNANQEEDEEKGHHDFPSCKSELCKSILDTYFSLIFSLPFPRSVSLSVGWVGFSSGLCPVASSFELE